MSAPTSRPSFWAFSSSILFMTPRPRARWTKHERRRPGRDRRRRPLVAQPLHWWSNSHTRAGRGQVGGTAYLPVEDGESARARLPTRRAPRRRLLKKEAVGSGGRPYFRGRRRRSPRRGTP